MIALVLALASAAPDPTATETMRLWCLQSGRWKGSIDITAADGKIMRPELISDHSCSRDGRWHLVTEAFAFPGKPLETTVKVTYTPSGAPRDFTTAYFINGRESQHRYRAVEARGTDATHWTTTIESTDAGETFDGRPATTRYTRAMNGDTLESRKEVKLVGETVFTTRSHLVQKRVR